mgnify:FL=1
MSHPVRVRGLKHILPLRKTEKVLVAPRAGAWIETCSIATLSDGIASHPVRVRGLKLNPIFGFEADSCRTPCGCVD